MNKVVVTRAILVLLIITTLILLVIGQIAGADATLLATDNPWAERGKGVLYGLHVSLLLSALLCYVLLRQPLCGWYAMLAAAVLATKLAFDIALEGDVISVERSSTALRVAGFLFCTMEAATWLYTQQYLRIAQSEMGRAANPVQQPRWLNRLIMVMLSAACARAVLVMLLPLPAIGMLSYQLSLLTPLFLLLVGLVGVQQATLSAWLFNGCWVLLAFVLAGLGGSQVFQWSFFAGVGALLHMVALLMLSLLGFSMMMTLTRVRPVQIRLSGNGVQPLLSNREEAQLLAKVSHEIRTPMNGILGLTELLQETRLDSEQRRFIKAIRNAGDALVEVVNDVLDLSRLEAGKLKLKARPFNIQELVQDSLLIFELAARRKLIQLSCSLTPGLPEWVVGDGGRIRQVIINLLSNAIKYTERGFVRLDVGLSDEIIDNQIVLKIDVLDSGIGISESEKEQLFQSYSQLDSPLHEREVGAGLGLAISRQLVGLMGGDMGVESYPGRGSRFWFTVPVQVGDEWNEDGADAGAESGNAGLAVPDGNLPSHLAGSEDPGWQPEPDASHNTQPVVSAYEGVRLLVAEDNDINLKVIAGFLDRLGLQADRVVNGKQALDKVRMSEQPYDLILMDCEMPIMDGFAATQAIHQWQAQQGLAKTPIIALTAYATDFHILKAEQSGMALHLSKPLNFQRFADAIERGLQWDAAAHDTTLAYRDNSL